MVQFGHVLTNLSDDADIKQKCRDMVHKANNLLATFPHLPPNVLTYLFRSFCLSLYGCSLWTISSNALGVLEVAYKKLLRRIWKLPYNSHTGIVHRVAGLSSIFNPVQDRSSSLVHGALRCSSPLIKQVFRQSLCCCSNFVVRFNNKYSMKYIKFYTVTDTFKAAVVRDMRLATPFLSVGIT